MMSVLAFLPSQNEPVQNIAKRYNDMIRATAHGAHYQGILLTAEDAELQAVLKALRAAMFKPEAGFQKKTKKYVCKGKTANDHQTLQAKGITQEERDKARSAASQKVRAEMKGRCGKQ